MSIEFVSQHVIACSIRDLRSNGKIRRATVYGLHSIVDRKDLWQELLQLENSVMLPWLALGDFNFVFEVSHIFGGKEVSYAKIEDGRQWMVNSNVGFEKLIGHYISWHNNQVGDKIYLGLIMSYLTFYGLISILMW